MSRLMHRSNFHSTGNGKLIISFIVAILLSISLLSAFVYDCYTDMIINTECAGHLKLASDANSIKLAEQELSIAIQYIENHGWTKGSTGVIFHYPQYDIGFWYNNLKSSQEQLKKLLASSEVTPLSQIEETNTLMKLRETLLDHHEGGDVITIPDSINMYPNCFKFMIWVWVSLIGTVYSWLWFVYEVKK